MILHASRLRSSLPMIIGMFIGSIAGGLLVRGPNIIEILPLVGGSLIGVSIASLLIPIRKLDVTFKENNFLLPGRNIFAGLIKLPLSEIDFDKSKIGRFGEGRIITNTGEKHVLSTLRYSRKNIQKLFTEIKCLHNTQND